MQIAQVMYKAGQSQGCEYFFFDQACYGSHAGVGEGVCHALCKVWIKSVGKIHTRNFEAFAKSNLSRIVAKQNKASEQRYINAKFSATTIVSKVTMTINNKGDEFWSEFSEAMSPGRFLGKIGRINYGKRADHAIATIRNKDKFLFFDPNGGILEFDDDIDLDSFLERKLKKAAGTSYNYGDIRYLMASEFTPKEYDTAS